MRIGVPTALGALVAVAAAATPGRAQNVPGWEHEAEAGVQFAYFTGNARELTVRCKGAQVEVVFYIEATVVDPALRARDSAVLALVMDDRDDLEWIPTRLVPERDVVSIGVGGTAANGLAHDMANATKSIVVSVMTEPPKAGSVQYNRSQFPVFGAAAAIKAAYAACGIPF